MSPRMIRFSYLLLLVLTFFLPVIYYPSIVFGVEPSSNDIIKDRYQQAKFYYNQLETKGSLGQSRENWLKGTSNFRKIYLSSPKSEYAPASLYMLGGMYFSMYEKFHAGIDLGDSLSYYRDTARLFPNHSLADDALFHVGNILLDEIKDPKRAAASFSKIVTRYPDGDMYTEASTKLKSLSKEYNIPLPTSMVGTSIKDLNYVLPVKYWSSNNYTRIVIKASGPVAYREQLLERSANKPRRLYIDFKNSYIEPKYRAPVPIQNGLLKQIRTGQYSPDTVRVVLDIESISDYKIFSLPDPFRVVVDVKGLPADAGLEAKRENTGIVTDMDKPAEEEVAIEDKVIVLRDNKKVIKSGKSSLVYLSPRKTKTFVSAGEKQEEDVIDAPTLSLAQQLGLGVKKIVIDPGHGGKDPGAIASNGLKEKDIVLKIAQKLRKRLTEETGAEIILTRNKDIFIPLEERTAVANANDADLFISLHINAHPSPEVRGFETYYLNLSTNAEAMRVAARENATSTHQMSDLQDILSDIMKNSKINESSRLAEQVHNSILTGLSTTPYNHTKNLGVKQAPFYVLIGAEMPAILLELGFISNPKELEFLNNDQYLNILTDEISAGIKLYINKTTASL